MAGELAAEWIKIPDGNGNLQKVWVRDSTARRDVAQLQTDLAQLQTDVGGLVIPDPSDAAPQMDGTAAAGVSTDYARADHVHPSDTSKQDAATTGTLTFNDTSYNQTYMDSASGKWERIGNIVVFNLTYKMKSSISSHLTSAILGFPNCPITAHFLSESSVSDVAARHVAVSGDKGTIAGAHSGGVTYYVSGAYLTE